MKAKLPLIFILLIALFLRLYQLDSLPVALFGDEIDVGYHAWSLATTGRDYTGHFLPTYIQSLSESRAPLLMYLTAPFVGLLGQSNFSVRLPAALLGVAGIYLVYLLTNLLYPKRRFGLIAAAVLTVTPWHLHYSRAAFELTLLFSLTLLACYWYLLGRDDRKYYYFSLFPFILTFYTYSTANLFTPILVILLLLLFPPDYKKLFQRRFFPATIAAGLIALPIFYHLVFGAAAGRFKLINIFSDQKVLDQVIIDRTRPWVSAPLLEKIFHNKATAYLAVFGKNYLTAFSTEFLLVSGDPNFRQSVSRFGQLLVVTAPFLLIGLAQVVGGLKNRANLFIILWLLLVPIGSSLTVGGANHASRLFLMIFPLTVLVALGFSQIIALLGRPQQTVFLIIASFALFLNFAAYWYRYSAHYRYESASVWQYGYEPLIKAAAPYLSGAGRVFINNTANPSLYRFAFYAKIPPADFQKMFKGDIPADNVLPGFNGFAFGDRFFFGRAASLEVLPKLLQPGDLYLAVQGEEVPGDWDWSANPPAGLFSRATVRDFYGRPLMYVMEKK